MIKQRISLAALGLAAALLATGCVKTHPLQVRAFLNDGLLTIDESYHQEADVYPGDRLEWSCLCPEGAQFAVRDLHALANMDELARTDKQAPREALDSARDGRTVRTTLSYDPGDPFLGKLRDTGTLGDDNLLSEPYRKFDDDLLWKFTWVVTMDGQEPAVWDPHFSGHKRRR